MANENEIIWSFEANSNLETIVHYLQSEWTEKEVQKFIFKLNKALLLITSRPQLFRLTNKRKGIRKFVLTKHTSIFYLQQKSFIYIVALFDNRQDPKKTPR